MWEKDWRLAGCWRVRLYPDWVSYFVFWEDSHGTDVGLIDLWLLSTAGFLHRKPEVSELWLYIFIRATLLVIAHGVCVSVSVTSRCSVELAGRIELAVGTDASFDLSCTALQANSGIYRTNLQKLINRRHNIRANRVDRRNVLSTQPDKGRRLAR